MDLKKLKEKIKIAKDVVSDEEEGPYKVAIFQVILQRLLNDNFVPNSKQAKNNSELYEKPVTSIGKNLLEDIEINNIQYLKSLTSVLDKCLALLSYLSENLHQSQGLTTDELKEILAEKFGLTTVTINNISMSLKHVTGKYVTRVKISDKTEKYRYQILEKGNQYVKKRIEQITKTT